MVGSIAFEGGVHLRQRQVLRCDLLKLVVGVNDSHGSAFMSEVRTPAGESKVHFPVLTRVYLCRRIRVVYGIEGRWFVLAVA
jgi:hypothetical protein